MKFVFTRTSIANKRASLDFSKINQPATRSGEISAARGNYLQIAVTALGYEWGICLYR